VTVITTACCAPPSQRSQWDRHSGPRPQTTPTGRRGTGPNVQITDTVCSPDASPQTWPPGVGFRGSGTTGTLRYQQLVLAQGLPRGRERVLGFAYKWAGGDASRQARPPPGWRAATSSPLAGEWPAATAGPVWPIPRNESPIVTTTGEPKMSCGTIGGTTTSSTAATSSNSSGIEAPPEMERGGSVGLRRRARTRGRSRSTDDTVYWRFRCPERGSIPLRGIGGRAGIRWLEINSLVIK